MDILDILPQKAEVGVGLAIKKEGHYLFFVAGEKYSCPPGEIFYAGIGGHLEDGESLADCAHREAREEIGADIEILSSSETYYVTHKGSIERVRVKNMPRPFAVYEMVNPEGAPRAGQLYYIVIFEALLKEPPGSLNAEEVRGIIALTEDQVIKGIDRKLTLRQLRDEGAYIAAGGYNINDETYLYPIGTARALAHILLLKRAPQRQ